MKSRGRTHLGVGVIILLAILLCMPIAALANRFIDNNNGTVTDARTGLVWLKNACPYGGGREAVVAYCSSLKSGDAGLTDGSVAGDWRLPSKEELEGIGTDPPATWDCPVPVNQICPSPYSWTTPSTPFTGVNFSNYYWSSTSYATNTAYGWTVSMRNGNINATINGNGGNVWPVRGQITTTTTEQPTVIELSSFTATPKSDKVNLEWTTEAEIDNVGFNLYRSESEDGDYTKINTALIPAKGSPTQGASYEFIDTAVQNRKTYYYKLEDIDLNGKSTMHSPVSATPRLIYAIGK